MKKNKVLINILYWFFTISFWFFIVLIGFFLSLEVFAKEGKIELPSTGTLMSQNHHALGYDIPVKFHFYIQKPAIKRSVSKAVKDSLGNIISRQFMSYSNTSDTINGGKFQGLMKEDAFLNKETKDSVVNISEEIIKKGGVLQIDHTSFNDHVLKVNSNSLLGDSSISIKSSNIFFTICQIIRFYIGNIILLLLFYQLRKIFKRLKKGVSFSAELFKRIKNVGLLLMFLEIINLLISFVFGRYYMHIGLDVLKYQGEVQLNIAPKLDFDIVFFTIGLSLVILSVLLKEGNTIKQENDLTI